MSAESPEISVKIQVVFDWPSPLPRASAPWIHACYAYMVTNKRIFVMVTHRVEIKCGLYFYRKFLATLLTSELL